MLSCIDESVSLPQRHLFRGFETRGVSLEDISTIKCRYSLANNTENGTEASLDSRSQPNYMGGLLSNGFRSLSSLQCSV